MSNWINTNKNSATFTNQVKNSATFTNTNKTLGFYILRENGFALLKENGDKLLRETIAIDSGWSNQTKN